MWTSLHLFTIHSYHSFKREKSPESWYLRFPNNKAHQANDASSINKSYFSLITIMDVGKGPSMTSPFNVIQYHTSLLIYLCVVLFHHISIKCLRINWWTDQRTDGLTERPTGRHRNARAQLKRCFWGPMRGSRSILLVHWFLSVRTVLVRILRLRLRAK